jgi:hypothetical protein
LLRRATKVAPGRTDGSESVTPSRGWKGVSQVGAERVLLLSDLIAQSTSLCRRGSAPPRTMEMRTDALNKPHCRQAQALPYEFTRWGQVVGTLQPAATSDGAHPSLLIATPWREPNPRQQPHRLATDGPAGGHRPSRTSQPPGRPSRHRPDSSSSRKAGPSPGPVFESYRPPEPRRSAREETEDWVLREFCRNFLVG